MKNYILNRKGVIFLENKKLKLDKAEYRRGLKEGIPAGFGYLPVSMACGVASCKAGIAFGMSQFMSISMYTASGQAAAIRLLQGGETAILMFAFTLFVINCRYLLLSLSIAQRFDGSMGTIQRILFGLLNTDETFGIAMKSKGKLNFSYLIGLVIPPYIGFLIGNATGCLLNDFLPKSISSVLGIVLFAMFIGIIVVPAKKSRPVAVVVGIALAISYVLECVPAIKDFITSGKKDNNGLVIIACAIITSLIGAILFPVEDKEEKIEAIAAEKEEK